MWSRELCFFGRWDLRTKERAITVNSGSYVRVCFSGTSLHATFDLTLNQPHCTCTKEGSYPTIAWQLDDGPWQEVEISARVTLADNLGKGVHKVMLLVRGLDEHQSRWNPPLVASVTFTGFETQKLERALPQWKKPKLTMEFLGDSITEGVIVNEGRAGVVPGIPFTWPWLADARQSYAAQTALALGAEWRQVGFGATGLKRVGSGGVPGALDAFELFYAGCPRDRWQPDVVVINQGTNESSMLPTDYQRLYGQYLVQIRRAYPQAKIVALRPFVGAQEVPIKAAAAERNAAGDARVYYVDSTGWYEGPLHPAILGSAMLAEKLVRALEAQVLQR